MLFKSIKYFLRPFKLYFYNFIFKLQGHKFEYFFNISNFLFLRWPIKVLYLNNGIYQVKDNNGKVLNYSRPVRTKRYRNGINAKLNSLACEYLYDFYDINNEDIIIDVGANIGEFSLFFEKKYNAKIIAIEPIIVR